VWATRLSTFAPFYTVSQPILLFYSPGKSGKIPHERPRSKESYGVKQPHSGFSVRRDKVKEDEWVLVFNLPEFKNFRWVYVDFVVRVDRSERKAYLIGAPFQAIQTRSSKAYPPPPFKIDAGFRDAFKSSAKDFGLEKFKDLLKPPRGYVQRRGRGISIGSRRHGLWRSHSDGAEGDLAE
jgi:hypothetical protein